MGEIVIGVSHLTKNFPSVRAVDDLSFEVPAGAVVGFLGPNGAGKTTTIRLLLGLLEPTAGTVSVFGRDVVKEGDAVRSMTGALLEHHGLYERLSAEDNLAYYARIWKLPASARQQRVRELLDHFGLTSKSRVRVGTMSRGTKQKLAIARVLIHRPRLIFLDEPTAGLDPVAAASLRDDIARLASEEGTTVFMTTHNLHEAERLCDTVAVMNRGKLIAFGSPGELLAPGGGTRYLITGASFPDLVLATLERMPGVGRIARVDGGIEVDLTGGTNPTAVVRTIIDAGIEIDEVRRSRTSLEELFLTLMEENDAH